MSSEKTRRLIPWILVAALLVTNVAIWVHYTRKVSDLEELFDKATTDWHIALLEGDQLGAWPVGHPYYELCRFRDEIRRRLSAANPAQREQNVLRGNFTKYTEPPPLP